MRCLKDDFLKGLIGDRPGLGLDAVGIEHVARADDPVDLAGFGVHRIGQAPSPSMRTMSISRISP